MYEALLSGRERRLVSQPLFNYTSIYPTEEGAYIDRHIILDFRKVLPLFWNQNFSVYAPSRRLFSPDQYEVE